jgi:hypothetical protein
MNEHWESSYGTEFPMRVGAAVPVLMRIEIWPRVFDAATAGDKRVEQWILEWTKQTDYVLFCHSSTAPRRPKAYGFLRISDIFLHLFFMLLGFVTRLRCLYKEICS